MPGRARPNTAQFFHGVEEPFRLDVRRPSKNHQVHGWAALPNTAVTDQLNLRRWRIVSFWCYADFQERLNKRLVVLFQTRSSSFHVVQEDSSLDKMKRFKNFRTHGWAVLSRTRPSSFHSVEKFFCLDVMQRFKNIQVYGWGAIPNMFCHGPAHFAALKNYFSLMLCRLSTKFKWTAGLASSNTVQLILRRWRLVSFWCCAEFQQRSNERLVVLPQTRSS